MIRIAEFGIEKPNVAPIAAKPLELYRLLEPEQEKSPITRKIRRFGATANRIVRQTDRRHYQPKRHQMDLEAEVES